MNNFSKYAHYRLDVQAYDLAGGRQNDALFTTLLQSSLTKLRSVTSPQPMLRQLQGCCDNARGGLDGLCNKGGVVSDENHGRSVTLFSKAIRGCDDFLRSRREGWLPLLYSSMVTCCVLMNPTTCAIRSKAVYRFAGTSGAGLPLSVLPYM